jgi:hypothetical protein
MSRIVGPMSMTWVNWVRSPPASAILAGQWTTIGSRVPPRCEATCLPHWNGVLPAHAHAAEQCGFIDGPPQASRPPHFSVSCICCSAVSGMPFGIVSSLNDPVIVPSRLAPLSPQIQITRVSSSVPIRSSSSSIRPTLWSAFSWYPA